MCYNYTNKSTIIMHGQDWAFKFDLLSIINSLRKSKNSSINFHKFLLWVKEYLTLPKLPSASSSRQNILSLNLPLTFIYSIYYQRYSTGISMKYLLLDIEQTTRNEKCRSKYWGKSNLQFLETWLFSYNDIERLPVRQLSTRGPNVVDVSNFRSQNDALI